ncbi:MAG TPA: hypothetical protein V6D48_06385 [Oculatellaceae cyanobacterium]
MSFAINLAKVRDYLKNQPQGDSDRQNFHLGDRIKSKLPYPSTAHQLTELREAF